jgi:hypothetical protein
MPPITDPVRLAGNRYGGLLRTGTPEQQREAKQHLESLRLERAINEALQADLNVAARRRLAKLLTGGAK